MFFETQSAEQLKQRERVELMVSSMLLWRLHVCRAYSFNAAPKEAYKGKAVAKAGNPGPLQPPP